MFFYRNIEKLNHPEKLIIIFYTSGTIEAKNSCFFTFCDYIISAANFSCQRRQCYMYIDNILAHTEGAATGLAINYATGNFDSMLVVVKE